MYKATAGPDHGQVFNDQNKNHGFHRTRQNCIVAYHKFNVRTCKLEKRFDTMDGRAEENKKKNADTSDKQQQVNKEVSTIKETIKKTKHHSAWHKGQGGGPVVTRVPLFSLFRYRCNISQFPVTGTEPSSIDLLKIMSNGQKLTSKF